MKPALAFAFNPRAETPDMPAEMLVYDYIGDGGVEPVAVINQLAALGERPLCVRVNSGGGSVTDGSAIYNALLAYKGKKTAKVEALAASMASVLCMACDEIEMAENAWMMIHNPFGTVCGTADEMRRMADVLDGMRKNLIGAYKRHAAGMDEEGIGEMMDAETWMDAETAVKHGFATRKTEALKMAACVSPEWKNTPEALANPVEPAAPVEPAPVAVVEPQPAEPVATSVSAIELEMVTMPKADADKLRAESALAVTLEAKLNNAVEMAAINANKAKEAEAKTKALEAAAAEEKKATEAAIAEAKAMIDALKAEATGLSAKVAALSGGMVANGATSTANLPKSRQEAYAEVRKDGVSTEMMLAEAKKRWPHLFV